MTDTPSSPIINDVSFDDAFDLIKEVAIAAHSYGSTSTRQEWYLSSLANRLGYSGVFRSNRTEIVVALSKGEDHPQRVEIIATDPPGLDLDKLARLGETIDEITAGKLVLKQAYAKIHAIANIDPPWGKFASMLGYAFTGLGLAPLLGGGWYDTLFATIFSIVVYGIVLITGKMGQTIKVWLPFITALAAGMLATITKIWIPELNLVLVVVSAIAILLPGYTISLGAGELAGQRIISGTANLMNGLLCMFQQIAGGFIGVHLIFKLNPEIISTATTPVSQAGVYTLFPFLLVGLCLSFQVAKRDMFWAVIVSAISYLGVLAGSALFNVNFGNLLGTIVAVVIANSWAKKMNRPSSIVLIPAIILLVSGTIGFRGLAAMAGGDLKLGIHQFMHMFVVAITIFAGILIGFTIVKPEKTL